MLNPSELKSQFTGKVIFPDDPEYDKARVIFYGGIDAKPAVILQVSNETDVVQAIQLAKTEKLDVAIRSGGHSFAGYCTCEGGIVIDLRNMKKVEIDAEHQSAWAETGLTAGELTAELDKQGFVVGFGDTGSVGVGGITLGGGIGYLVRKYGLTIDNVLAAKVVTSDGQILLTDKDTHPNLFWAIRGGGGNFGVVTAFQFQLHQLEETVGGMLILPATPETITGFMAEAEKAPDELSSIANVMPCPPMPFVPAEHHGKLVLMALMTYAGDAKSSEHVLAPFRALATPLADMLKPQRYKDMFPPEGGEYHPTAVSQTMFTGHIDLELAKTILAELENSTASMRVVQLRTLGGAMSRVPIDATAFAHRHSKILANIAAFYETPEEKVERQAWVKNLAEKLLQGDTGMYVNFTGAEDVTRLSDIYPSETLKRLAQVKQQYDPSNLFKLNCNIPPAE